MKTPHCVCSWQPDDPYLPQEQFEHIAEQLDPIRIKVTGGGHFIDQNRFPELLDYIKQAYSA